MGVGALLSALEVVAIDLAILLLCGFGAVIFVIPFVLYYQVAHVVVLTLCSLWWQANKPQSISGGAHA